MLFSNEKGELYWNEKNIVFQKKNILFRSFLCTEMFWLVPAILLRLKFQNTHRLWVIYGQLVCYVNKWLSIAQLWWLLLWAIAQCLYSVRPEPSLVGIWPAAWSCHQVAGILWPPPHQPDSKSLTHKAWIRFYSDRQLEEWESKVVTAPQWLGFKVHTAFLFIWKGNVSGFQRNQTTQRRLSKVQSRQP